MCAKRVCELARIETYLFYRIQDKLGKHDTNVGALFGEQRRKDQSAFSGLVLLDKTELGKLEYLDNKLRVCDDRRISEF